MGFLDKAKKMAEQAQEKLEEVQKDFNAKQGSGGQSSAGAGAAVQYDEHGRAQTPQAPDLPSAQPGDLSQPKGDPLSAEPTAPAATPQQGDPLTSDTPPTPDPAQTPASADPAPNRPHGDPLITGENASRHGADADRGERPNTPPPAEGSGLTSGDPLG